MQQVVLGRTGLEVSVAGLGCGGHSRLGQSTGATQEHSIDLVRRALDLGVTLIDTARVYGTEEIVGRAVEGRRDEVVLSTKVLPERDGRPITVEELRTSVELSLRRLRTDRIDLFFVHGLGAEHLDHCREVLVPELVDLRAEGKIRFLAASEAFAADPGHHALRRAFEEGDDWFDVLMVGFNLLNSSARQRVLHHTRAADIGVLVMFAVRRALSDPGQLRSVVEQLVESGDLDATDIDVHDPLGFLTADGAAGSLVEAAYRYARHEPGCHVVLTGTGSVEHLEQNLGWIAGPPLPDHHLERLAATFGSIDSVSGN
jgi:L-galactose dehydrogenase